MIQTPTPLPGAQALGVVSPTVGGSASMPGGTVDFAVLLGLTQSAADGADTASALPADLMQTAQPRALPDAVKGTQDELAALTQQANAAILPGVAALSVPAILPNAVPAPVGASTLPDAVPVVPVQGLLVTQPKGELANAAAAKPGLATLVMSAPVNGKTAGRTPHAPQIADGKTGKADGKILPLTTENKAAPGETAELAVLPDAQGVAVGTVATPVTASIFVPQAAILPVATGQAPAVFTPAFQPQPAGAALPAERTPAAPTAPAGAYAAALPTQAAPRAARFTPASATSPLAQAAASVRSAPTSPDPVPAAISAMQFEPIEIAPVAAQTVHDSAAPSAATAQVMKAMTVDATPVPLTENVAAPEVATLAVSAGKPRSADAPTATPDTPAARTAAPTQPQAAPANHPVTAATPMQSPTVPSSAAQPLPAAPPVAVAADRHAPVEQSAAAIAPHVEARVAEAASAPSYTAAPASAVAPQPRTASASATAASPSAAKPQAETLVAAAPSDTQPTIQRTVRAEAGAPASPARAADEPVQRLVQATTAHATPAPVTGFEAAPVIAAAPDGAAPLSAVTTGETPHDFDTLVSRLAEAREAAAPHVVRTAFDHAEFGRVAMQLTPGADGLAVTLTSHDPEFAGAVQAAAASMAMGNGSAQDGEQPRHDAPTSQQQQAQQQQAGATGQGATGGQNPQQARTDASGQQQARRDGGGSNRQPDRQQDAPAQGRSAERRQGGGGIYA